MIALFYQKLRVLTKAGRNPKPPEATITKVNQIWIQHAKTPIATFYITKLMHFDGFFISIWVVFSFYERGQLALLSLWRLAALMIDDANLNLTYTHVYHEAIVKTVSILMLWGEYIFWCLYIIHLSQMNRLCTVCYVSESCPTYAPCTTQPTTQPPTCPTQPPCAECPTCRSCTLLPMHTTACPACPECPSCELLTTSK